jgi:hypothetical protein
VRSRGDARAPAAQGGVTLGPEQGELGANSVILADSLDQHVAYFTSLLRI